MSTVPQIVGFGGYMQAGKDTAAAMIVESDGHTLASFGEHVCSLLLAVNPVIEVGDGTFPRAREVFDTYGYEEAKKVGDFRLLLQNLGSGMNDRDSGFWARQVLADLGPDGRSVISGLRSLAQIAAVRQAGGVTVWIDNPHLVQAQNHAMGHRNENEVGPEDFDVVVVNDSTLDVLRERLFAALAA